MQVLGLNNKIGRLQLLHVKQKLLFVEKILLQDNNALKEIGRLNYKA